MFRRSMSAMGGRRRGPSVLGGRTILVPPKSAYPYQRAGLNRAGHQALGQRPSAADKRRRNLTRLAVFIIVTFVLGIVPALRFLLVLNLIADVLLILYLGLALYMAVWPSPSQTSSPTPPVDPALQPQRVAEGGF
jgi:hypothetical protein